MEKINNKGKNNPNWKGGDFFKCNIESCNNLIWRTPFNVKNGIGKFCSKKCFGLSLKGKKGIIPNKKTRSKIKLSKLGEKNPKWNGGETQLFICPICKNKLYVTKGRLKTIKFCSYNCANKEISRRLTEKNPMKNKEIAKKMGETLSNKWKKDIKFRKKMIKNVFSNIKQNKLEKKFEEEFINKYKLPFKYVGNRKFWITCDETDFRNPDFIHNDFKNNKLVIEILGSYWHTVEDVYQKQKSYDKVKVKYLFIWDYETENEIELLNKINIFIKENEI